MAYIGEQITKLTKDVSDTGTQAVDSYYLREYNDLASRMEASFNYMKLHAAERGDQYSAEDLNDAGESLKGYANELEAIRKKMSQDSQDRVGNRHFDTANASYTALATYGATAEKNRQYTSAERRYMETAANASSGGVGFVIEQLDAERVVQDTNAALSPTQKSELFRSNYYNGLSGVVNEAFDHATQTGDYTKLQSVSNDLIANRNQIEAAIGATGYSRLERSALSALAMNKTGPPNPRMRLAASQLYHDMYSSATAHGFPGLMAAMHEAEDRKPEVLAILGQADYDKLYERATESTTVLQRFQSGTYKEKFPDSGERQFLNEFHEARENDGFGFTYGELAQTTVTSPSTMGYYNHFMNYLNKAGSEYQGRFIPDDMAGQIMTMLSSPQLGILDYKHRESLLGRVQKIRGRDPAAFSRWRDELNMLSAGYTMEEITDLEGKRAQAPDWRVKRNLKLYEDAINGAAEGGDPIRKAFNDQFKESNPEFWNQLPLGWVRDQNSLEVPGEVRTGIEIRAHRYVESGMDPDRAIKLATIEAFDREDGWSIEQKGKMFSDEYRYVRGHMQDELNLGPDAYDGLLINALIASGKIDPSLLGDVARKFDNFAAGYRDQYYLRGTTGPHGGRVYTLMQAVDPEAGFSEVQRWEEALDDSGKTTTWVPPADVDIKGMGTYKDVYATIRNNGNTESISDLVLSPEKMQFAPWIPDINDHAKMAELIRVYNLGEMGGEEFARKLEEWRAEAVSYPDLMEIEEAKAEYLRRIEARRNPQVQQRRKVYRTPGQEELGSQPEDWLFDNYPKGHQFMMPADEKFDSDVLRGTDGPGMEGQ